MFPVYNIFRSDVADTETWRTDLIYISTNVYVST